MTLRHPGDVGLIDVEVKAVMVKCPFCSFANEDGALFCEQCKSDISSVAPAAAPLPAPPPPTPMPESLPPGEIFPMAAEEPVMAAVVVEEEPPVIAIVEDEAPVVAIVEEEPPVVAIVEEEAPVVAIVEEPPPAPPPPAPPAPVIAAAAVAAAPPPAPAPAPAKPAGAQTPIPVGAEVKLVVQRGLKIGEEYNLFPGENFVGRADEKPVDVDLTFQEPEDRVWCSRQHALIVYDDTTGALTIEDLNSSNGTFVNRARVYPGQPCQLYVGNTIQIGTVHMRIKV
jgi:hypothetical protein